MPDRPVGNHPAALYPNDLEMLQTVLDALCCERNILPDSEEARDMAADLVSLFLDGLTGEEGLKATVRAHFAVRLRGPGCPSG